MKSKIRLSKIWFDDDVVELDIDVSDGKSSFANSVYVGHQRLKEIASELDRFKDQVDGGIYDLRLGEFGPEFVSGAFHARMHFHDRGYIYITVLAQSEFKDFARKNVASEATLYLVSQPALLDDFIRALTALSIGQRDDAELEAV
ncbi:hypothetical protein [Paraherbaspirillum soli]|uniref:DUF1795 domain-containing protein n=1 Tax=Paraherbaspirillum soli TaxID=631222 RepID=A0ABW0MBD1_9BURK